MNSREKVKSILSGNGSVPCATFDCLGNDAVIEHFAGERAGTDEAGRRAIHRAINQSLDSTRILILYPRNEGEEDLGGGRFAHHQRWTSWYGWKQETLTLEGIEAYVRNQIERAADDEARAAWMKRAAQTWMDTQAEMPDTFLFGNPGCKTGLMLYTEIGLEAFTRLMMENPDLISTLLETATRHSVKAIENAPLPDEMTAVFDCEDIAYKNGPIFSPTYLRAEFFPMLEAICDAWHRRGKKFIYHSDGNLMSLIDDLVACGIDGLNPIETIAGMDVKEIRRRFPNLVLIGGVDCSQVLPNGTPTQVRDETRRILEAAEGRILIGSSSEVHNEVPLANYLAMHEAIEAFLD